MVEEAGQAGKVSLVEEVMTTGSLKNSIVTHLILVALISIFAPSVSYGDQSQQNMVFSGVVLEQGNNNLLSDFTNWLSKKAHINLSTDYTDSYQELSDTLQKNPLSIAWTCGVPFVEDSKLHGQQLVAIPLFNGSPTYSSLVVALAGGKGKKLEDYKGGVFAYSDQRSNSGFVAPTSELKKVGIDINAHFRYLMHTGLHEYSIEAVLNGQADVANIDEYVVVQYLKANPEAKDKLVVLESFGPYPFTPIVAGSKVPERVIRDLQSALVNMHEDPEGVRLLKEFGLDGFVVKPPSFYDPIDKMLQGLRQ